MYQSLVFTLMQCPRGTVCLQVSMSLLVLCGHFLLAIQWQSSLKIQKWGDVSKRGPTWTHLQLWITSHTHLETVLTRTGVKIEEIDRGFDVVNSSTVP